MVQFSVVRIKMRADMNGRFTRQFITDAVDQV